MTPTYQDASEWVPIHCDSFVLLKRSLVERGCQAGNKRYNVWDETNPLVSVIALSPSVLNSRLSKEVGDSEKCEGAWEDPGLTAWAGTSDLGHYRSGVLVGCLGCPNRRPKLGFSFSQMLLFQGIKHERQARIQSCGAQVGPWCSKDRYFSTLGTGKPFETKGTHRRRTGFILIKMETGCWLWKLRLCRII